VADLVKAQYPTLNVSAAAIPATELDKLSGTVLSVVPRSLEAVEITRASFRRTYGIDVGYQKRVAADTEVPTLCEAVETLLAYLWNRQLSGVAVRFVSAKIEPVYVTEHLQQFRVFTSVVRLEYAG
jgi:hypothetical protein